MAKIVVLLERIAAGQEDIRDEVRELRGEVGQLHGEVRQTNVRLDHVIGFMGAQHRDHEQRIRALEHEIFKQAVEP
jgi:predicted  nucleic acid-binding Zn-ribbon protein